MKKVFVAIFLLLECAFAQDWYYGKPVRRVEFKGLEHVKASELEAVTASFVGREFSDEMFSEMVNELYALDLFEDITPEALPGDAKKRTVIISFAVKERPIISRIVIAGNKSIRNAQIRDTIAIKEKDVFVEDKVRADIRAIMELYITSGFPNTLVEYATRENERGVILTFNIDEGARTVVAAIEFEGNKAVSSKTLKGKISLKEAKTFGKGSFQEAALEQDKVSITAFYQDRGYADAAVTDVRREMVHDAKRNRDEITITFVVQEGVVYTFEGIEFEGNEIFSSETLTNLVRLKKGATFNQTKLQEGLRACADLYYENGYTSNGFYSDLEKDAERATVKVVVHIEERDRSHIEKIAIKGNKKTHDNVILRELPFSEGDIFSKARVQGGIRNLLNLQYFSAVVPQVLPGSEENLVELEISLEEQSTTSVEFGLTFSGVEDPDELPFALFVKWQDSNVLGTGRTLSASTTLATKQQSLSLGWAQSWTCGKPVSLSFNVGVSHSEQTSLRNYIDHTGYNAADDYYMEWEQWRVGFGVGAGRRWFSLLGIVAVTGGVDTVVKTNVYDDVWVPIDTTVDDYANKWGVANDVWTAVSLDARDINYDPSRGYFFSQRLTWYGLLPNESDYFLRSDTKAEKYFTLFNVPLNEKYSFKAVLAGYTGLSMLFPYNDTTLGVTNKLYIDGLFNGRGWSNLYNKKVARGRFLWDSNVELRIPVVPGILAVDGFFDAVVVNHVEKGVDTRALSQYNYSSIGEYYAMRRAGLGEYNVVHDEPGDLLACTIEDFYFSLGPSIRFCLPQFPLRLLFARRFRVRNNAVKWEDNGNFKFVLSFNFINK